MSDFVLWGLVITFISAIIYACFDIFRLHRKIYRIPVDSLVHSNKSSFGPTILTIRSLQPGYSDDLLSNNFGNAVVSGGSLAVLTIRTYSKVAAVYVTAILCLLLVHFIAPGISRDSFVTLAGIGGISLYFKMFFNVYTYWFRPKLSQLEAGLQAGAVFNFLISVLLLCIYITFAKQTTPKPLWEHYRPALCMGSLFLLGMHVLLPLIRFYHLKNTSLKGEHRLYELTSLDKDSLNLWLQAKRGLQITLLVVAFGSISHYVESDIIANQVRTASAVFLVGLVAVKCFSYVELRSLAGQAENKDIVHWIEQQWKVVAPVCVVIACLACLANFTVPTAALVSTNQVGSSSGFIRQFLTLGWIYALAPLLVFIANIYISMQSKTWVRWIAMALATGGSGCSILVYNSYNQPFSKLYLIGIAIPIVSLVCLLGMIVISEQRSRAYENQSPDSDDYAEILNQMPFFFASEVATTHIEETKLNKMFESGLIMRTSREGKEVIQVTEKGLFLLHEK